VFVRTFHVDAPENISGKEAVYKRGSLLIEKDGELASKYISFLCAAKLGKKREFVCCSQDITLPPLFVIEQSCGTEKGLGEHVYEKEVCRLSSGVKKFDYMAKLDIEASGESFPMNKIIRLNINEIDICIKIKTSQTFFTQMKNPTSCFRANLFDPIVIRGIDIGRGNTLGYCANINGWEKPFEFSCAHGNWIGLIPSYSSLTAIYKIFCFRFVKIDSQGKVHWENYFSGGRYAPRMSEFPFAQELFELRNPLCHPCYVAIVTRVWTQYLKKYPIEFSL
jgi:hypothetical protein